MNKKEAADLNRDLLGDLREWAPWAADQVEETVRQGKRVSKNVRRKLRKEKDVVVDEKKSLGYGKLAMTHELTETESLLVTLEAIDCLLVQPGHIAQDVDRYLKDIEVTGAIFLAPSEREERMRVGGTLDIPQETRRRISTLIRQIRSDLQNDN